MAFSILKTLPNSHPEMSLIGNQLDYQLEVNRLLKGSPYREQRMKDDAGKLTKAELERMEEARLFGTPAYVFAARLLEADSRDLAIYLKTRELFQTDPTCRSCTTKIDRLEDAALITLADGSAYIQHDNSACFSKSINAMATRYFGRPRQARAS